MRVVAGRTRCWYLVAVKGVADEPAGREQRLVGMPDVEAVREMMRGFERIDNKFGGGVGAYAVVRYLDGVGGAVPRDGW